MRNEPAGSQEAQDRAAEIDLCTTLLIASSRSDEILTQDEVDRLLGVRNASPA